MGTRDVTDERSSEAPPRLRWRQAIIMFVLAMLLFALAKTAGINVGNVLITFVIVGVAVFLGVGLERLLPRAEA